MAKEHFVVIGNGPAGHHAALTLREKDDKARITLISRDRCGCYRPHLLPGQLMEIRNMADRCHQKMAVDIGEFVHHHQGRLPRVEGQIGFGGQGLAKDAPLRLFIENIFDSPRCPDSLHTVLFCVSTDADYRKSLLGLPIKLNLFFPWEPAPDRPKRLFCRLL